MLNSITLLLLVTTICSFYCVAILKTSHVPLKLSMWKVKRDRRSAVRRGKSKITLFQEVLGLKPDEPFIFNRDKWEALKNSGLFVNLTASSAMSHDGVVLNITGYELPSTKFSPEVAVVASLENPEVHGGVSS